MNSATVLNLASIVEHNAKLYPQREAVVYGDARLTFKELNAFSNRVANALVEMGIGYGDKVALCCSNLPFFPIVYYGIMKAGAAVVPLNILLKPREVAYYLKDSEAKAVFVDEGTSELALAQTVKEGFDSVESCKNLVIMASDPDKAAPFENAKTLAEITAGASDEFEIYPTKSDDTCAILYTSGTTGQPKGAELTHLNLMTNVTTTHALYLPVLDFTDSVQKTALITLPLFHTTAQTCQMNTNLYGGNRVVLLPRFDAQTTLETMVAERVNFWVGVPTMYWALLKYVEENDFDTAPIAEHIKVVTSGGAPMPVEVMRKFEEKFNVRVTEGYGLSETSPLATFNHLDKQLKPGTVGQAIFGVEVRCVDDRDCEVECGARGEVVIRGSNVMKGYYKRPEATAEAFRGGWFHTGDIGTMDEDGYLAIVDRKKDMILRGGYNIYPRELEEVLMTHEAVSLVAVIGVPDDRLGEEVKAFIVPKPGFDLSETEVINWCRQQFASNKYPRLVDICESLPISATGKILKRELRKN